MKVWDTRFVLFCFVSALGGILLAVLVMLGSAATVSCFVMARNMGHEGVLSSSVVAITTCGSAFTLTLWVDLIRTLGLI